MATIVRTPSATWKAVIRKQGWPTTAKTFSDLYDLPAPLIGKLKELLIPKR